MVKSRWLGHSDEWFCLGLTTVLDLNSGLMTVAVDAMVADECASAIVVVVVDAADATVVVAAAAAVAAIETVSRSPEWSSCTPHSRFRQERAAETHHYYSEASSLQTKCTRMSCATHMSKQKSASRMPRTAEVRPVKSVNTR